MKKRILFGPLFLLCLFVLISVSGQTQQSFTVTSSRANNYCNGTCTLFDVPDLNGNPTAIIFITPMEVNGVNLDPHPICAYYNGKQWSVMNVDNSTMPVGAQFNVQYYSKPDDIHFVHIVTKENLVKYNSYIDHAGLNQNPGAKFILFQNVSPNVRGGLVNPEEIKVQFDEAAGKWYITNANGKALNYATGYNISVSSGSSSSAATASVNPVTPAATSIPFVPGPKVDNSGQRVFITVMRSAQDYFPGENMTNKMEVNSLELEVNVARDAATGQASGKRQYLPVSIQKNTDPASLRFFHALTANEVLSKVTIEVYKPNSAGAQILDYKIELSNAHVSGFKQSYIEQQKGFVDSIRLTFMGIDIQKGAIVYSDSQSTTQ